MGSRFSGNIALLDSVRHVKHGITGIVAIISNRRVLTETDDGFQLIPRVVITIRLTIADMYGEYADFLIDELVREG